MAIYKLKDLCSGKPTYGAPLASLEIGKYKYFRQTDIKFGFPTKFVNKTYGKIMKKNDFFISRAGTIEPYLHDKNEEWIYAGYLVKYPLNKKIIFPKYLFYYFKSKLGVNEIKANINTGSTMPKLNPPIALTLRVVCPSLQEQQKIIDIIEPKKDLFEKHHNCVRVDSFENTKKDLQKIIDIIEPINQVETKIVKMRQLFKKHLLNQYILNDHSCMNLDKIIKIHNFKHQKQLDYLPTAAVSELTYDLSSKIDLGSETKPLSRANLTVIPNSIIVSKLLGENKVLPITESETKYVYSTGFFNFTSENNNHLLAYFLSKHFQKQKKIYATGTTMLAITKDTLKHFQIKQPFSTTVKVN